MFSQYDQEDISNMKRKKHSSSVLEIYLLAVTSQHEKNPRKTQEKELFGLFSIIFFSFLIHNIVI